MIEKMIDREIGQPRNKVIELYEENGVYNFYIEMDATESRADEAQIGLEGTGQPAACGKQRIGRF